MTKLKIRNIIDRPMPFDVNGFHATGREVYMKAADGVHWDWFSEYENDDTVDLPNTETPEEETERYWEYRLEQIEREEREI